MSELKRSAPEGGASQPEKRGKYQQSKGKKQWRVPRLDKNGEVKTLPPTIESGDQGIWATCDMHKEAKCVGELKDMFYEYAEKLYGDELEKMRKEEPAETDEAIEEEAVSKADEIDLDIEAEIAAEIKEIRKPTKDPLFTNVKIDVQCVLFLKTRPPISPVSFVHHICQDLLTTNTRRTRFAKRLTPMTQMGKATESGLETIAKAVLPPHFHGKQNLGKTFAIRPTIRNHGKLLNRDYIIRTVASLVGPGHRVDLGKPELVILVEVYTNICGMSVVPGPEFEDLKRFNLAEIGVPPAKEEREVKDDA